MKVSKKKIARGMLLLAGVLAFWACNDRVDYEKMRKEELAILKKYIDEVHPDATKTESGLYYMVLDSGNVSDTIGIGDEAIIYYATWVLENDSTQLIDQSSGYLEGHRLEPLRFIVGAGSVVAGLDEGITYLHPGGKGLFIINSELAYGQGTNSTVGMFKTILKEVEVKDVIPLEDR